MTIQSFRHIAIDGLIYIANNDIESKYPYSWWIIKEPTYTLPAPYIYREYVKGVNGYHRVFTTIDQLVAPEGFPWAAGDIYISKKSEYDAAYDAYINVPPTLDEAKTIKINDLITKMEEIKAGDVIFNLVTYKSDYLSFEKLNLAYIDTLRGNTLPVGFYVNDIDLNQVSFTQQNLEDLLTKIQELHYLCNLNFDTHRLNIMALTNVPAVQSYVITTGWPTVPYNPI